MKPGDKVMLVGTQGFERRLHITTDTVKSVTKTGLIRLEGTSQQYRADGSPTGSQSAWSNPRHLQAWDDALWQRFQMESDNAGMASKLWDLGEAFKVLSRDHARAAEIWQSLPFAVRSLIEKETGA